LNPRETTIGREIIEAARDLTALALFLGAILLICWGL
jgi:hypothetical protein